MSNSPPRRPGGPRDRTPRPADGVQQIFNLAQFQQSFDKDAFDSLIKGQGVLVTHYKAIPDPSGMASIGDIHAVQSKRQSSDGFVYKIAGEMHLWFHNNSSDWGLEVEGMTKHDAAVITAPQKYEDCPDKDVILAAYDRFYLKDIEVRVVAMQFVEANTLGTDKLQYPATCVEYLIDADGKEYQEGVQFQITPDGFIQWISQDRPGFNEKTSRGTVYSIRYRYVPFFVVARLLNEIRVSQITDLLTMDRKLERMPFQALVVREQVLSDANRDPHKDIMDQRFQNAPPVSGSGGPNDTGSQGGML